MTPTSAPAAPRPNRSSAPALAPERPVAWPKRTVRTLSNGLQAVLAESRTFPKISAQLYFRSGNAVVARRAPGLAEMTATVVRTGTASRPSRQIEEDLRRMGAGLGTHAGADSSAISAAGLAEFSGGHSGIDCRSRAQRFLSRRGIRARAPAAFEELQHRTHHTGFLASERLRGVLFGAASLCCGRTLRGTSSRVTPRAARGVLSSPLRAVGSLLIVVGDFCRRRCSSKSRKFLASWKAPNRLASAWPAPPRQSGRRVHLVHLPGTRADAGAARQSGHHPPRSRLVSAGAGEFDFRRRVSFAPGASISASKRATPTARAAACNALRQYGYFTVRAAVRNEVAAATLTEMFYEMDRMRSLPVTAEELDSARSYLTGVFSLGVATQDGLLGQLSTVYLDQLPEDYLETYRERIRPLTAEDVIAAARRHFDSAERANRSGRRPRQDRRASRSLRAGDEYDAHGIAVRACRGARPPARQSFLLREWNLDDVGFASRWRCAAVILAGILFFSTIPWQRRSFPRTRLI